MRPILPFLATILVVTSIACSDPDTVSETDPGRTADTPGGSPQTLPVSFVGGYETDPRDHGRPVVLIGSALGVTEEIFRDAFSRVTPARGGPPSRDEARANKEVLMDALGKHGVTNERLDKVSDYYRYRREGGEVWKRTPATATAIVEDAKVTGFKITNAGAGYTTAPEVEVAGYVDLEVRVTIEFSTDFDKNGRVTSIDIVE